ncbi:NADPH:quinone reductase [Halorussus salinisoli]|uniref:NADPH:quinone reductase n=1 Tax=Halorussus salinisoli TaxID=2558242 RepID=UPI0010C16768|nr:NADPH:quinone reductase [Halorussus salinisoli]
MRAVRYHESGPPDALRLEDVPRPVPGPYELLVAVHTAGVNPVDAKYRARGHDRTPKTTGSDFAGVVEAAGDSVKEYEVGDRVFGTGFYSAGFRQGSFAEYVTVPTNMVAALPPSVSFEEGGAAGIVGTTAWLGLIERTDLGPVDACLIHGGAGGVGHVGVQLAKASGASVLATAGSPDRVSAAKEFGADDVFDYTDDVTDAVGRACPGGVDVILDPRYAENAQMDVDVAGFGADVIVIDGDGSSIDGPQARGKHLQVHMLSMTPLLVRDDLPTLSFVLRKLARLLADGTLSITVSRTYDLEDAATAHHDVMGENIVGKAAVTVR